MSTPWVPPPGWGNYTVREIIEVPALDPVSLFPATAAWWWPVGLVLLIVGTGSWRAIQYHRRNRYRREALAELERMRAAHDAQPLPVLMKATAMQAYGRTDVASLYGEAWLAFLTSKVPSAAFTGPIGQALLKVDYLPRESWHIAPAQSDALFAACATWIRQHPLPPEYPLIQAAEKAPRNSPSTT